MVELGFHELQAELPEQLLVPSCLPGIHLRLFFGDLLLVFLRLFFEHRLHEYDASASLETCLHLEQDCLEVLAMEVAEAPDAQDAVIPTLGPEVVLDESFVPDDISRHLGDHLFGPVQQLDVAEAVLVHWNVPSPASHNLKDSIVLALLVEAQVSEHSR